jgi:hypothetical protein
MQKLRWYFPHFEEKKLFAVHAKSSPSLPFSKKIMAKVCISGGTIYKEYQKNRKMPRSSRNLQKEPQEPNMKHDGVHFPFITWTRTTSMAAIAATAPHVTKPLGAASTTNANENPKPTLIIVYRRSNQEHHGAIRGLKPWWARRAPAANVNWSAPSCRNGGPLS